MHMSKLYPGHLHIASNNHTGRVYKDWRKKYFRKAGALMIEYLDSVPNKGEAYLFLKICQERICIHLSAMCKSPMISSISGQAEASISFS